MQPDMFASAVHALHLLLEPTRLLLLFIGVLIGLAIGVLPGLSGIVGLAMLIPFTYNLDEYTAFALLLGMAAVITSSDFITAVLFGVPGHVGAAATVIDGHAMARKGEAGRAFGAGFAASLAGGVVGAIVLGISIPILRPLMLSIGSPELLAFTLFGMSMDTILKETKVSQEIRDALENRTGFYGNLLKLAECSERMEKTGVEMQEMLEPFELTLDDFYELQLAAFEWSNTISASMGN